MMKQLIRYYSLVHWRQPRVGPKIQMKTLGRSWPNDDNFMILDFESTCEVNKKIQKQEIIEFPCIWTDSNLNVVSIFHSYVKPIHNPVLTPYCIELTGIIQEMVENEETFDKVLLNFLSWQEDVHKSVGNDKSTTFVTCGDWDLRTMLPSQCQLSGLPVPLSMTTWLNLKQIFMETTKYYPKSLKDMCQQLGLKFSGKEHSGIDDCHNILEILKVLKLKHGNL